MSLVFQCGYCLGQSRGVVKKYRPTNTFDSWEALMDHLMSTHRFLRIADKLVSQADFQHGFYEEEKQQSTRHSSYIEAWSQGKEGL